ncbi:MAG: M23 family metallopeptidase [Oscillospiraceae bacterium]|jgi:murein DD-endopeptidase MepM/ murein hydrolase activator NlpD/ribosomal protein L9|nr:M23 family metallopeptidase [Oscillospiraceae bacterium]
MLNDVLGEKKYTESIVAKMTGSEFGKTLKTEGEKKSAKKKIFAEEKSRKNLLTEEDVEVKDYTLVSQILFGALEGTVVVKDIAVDSVMAIGKAAVETKNAVKHFGKGVIESNLYKKIVFLSQDLKNYFQIRRHSVSYCREQLQFALYECSKMETLLGKFILQDTKRKQRELLGKSLAENRSRFSQRAKLPVRVRCSLPVEKLEFTAPKGFYPKSKINALNAFLLTVNQYTRLCVEDAVMLKNKLQRTILKTATFIGAMSVAGVCNSYENAVDTAKSAVSSVTAKKDAVDGGITAFVKERRYRLNRNLAEKKKTLRYIGKRISKSRKLGLKAFVYSLLTGTKDFYSAFSGMFKTAFNYAAPALAITLLIGLVSDFANREYGIALEMGGQQVAVLQKDSDYDKAEQIVIDKAGLSASLPEEPKYMLKIVNDKNEYTDSEQLADTLLSVTSNELTDAYNVVVDGEVIATVSDPKPIVDALDEELDFYNNGNVEGIQFSKNVEYVPTVKGESVLNDSGAVIEKLLGYDEKDDVYTVESGDVLETIAQDLGITTSDLKENNPVYDFDNIKPGDKLIYTKKDYYLPVVYTKTITAVSSVDYMSISVETDEVYKGNTSVLQEGKKGERSEVYNVTYTNGVEMSRELVSSEVTKSTQTEVLGIGTFVAAPEPKKETRTEIKTYEPSDELAEAGKYIWPVNGGYVSATMGDGRGHKGVDIAAPRGSEIYACAPGTVVLAGQNGGYGTCVIIDHGDGYRTLYGHMSELIAKEGQEVNVGDCIGLVGATGWATGNHLHIEVMFNGAYQNFLNYLP